MSIKNLWPYEFESAWEAPSNIAIIKYWGKSGLQEPANPNFSLTLSECVTKTKVLFTPRKEKWVDLFFEGSSKESFLPKITTFLDRLTPYCAWLPETSLRIETENSFPHGTGIASSASSMAALALCITSADYKLFPKKQKDFYQKASFIARLGSGSACRSLFPGGVTWGVEKNEYASPLENMHPLFFNLKDQIFIVSREEKKISSTSGHHQMEEHPFKTARYSQAKTHWEQLKSVLCEGDFLSFAEICEREALSLHAMIMTSKLNHIILGPQSLMIIDKIRRWRKQGHPVCFSLDAGPNVHLLFPREFEQKANSLVNQELLPIWPDAKWISDKVGTGPREFRS